LLSIAVHIRKRFRDNGDQEVEHDDHVEDSAEQEESDHQSKGNTTFVVTSIEASQNDVVNVDDGVHEATGEHICSNIFIPSCDTEERAPKGDEPNQEHQQEAPHIRNNHNDHSDEVASVPEDPHEVEQLDPHEEGGDGLDSPLEGELSFNVQPEEDNGSSHGDGREDVYVVPDLGEVVQFSIVHHLSGLIEEEVPGEQQQDHTEHHRQYLCLSELFSHQIREQLLPSVQCGHIIANEVFSRHHLGNDSLWHAVDCGELVDEGLGDEVRVFGAGDVLVLPHVHEGLEEAVEVEHEDHLEEDVGDEELPDGVLSHEREVELNEFLDGLDVEEVEVVRARQGVEVLLEVLIGVVVGVRQIN